MAGADHGGPHCDTLPANITSAHPDWDESLDADHDGIGCEDENAPPWTPPATETPTTAPPEVTTTVPAPEPAAAAPAEPVVDEPDFTG